MDHNLVECIICNEKTDEKITLFTPEVLQKCRKVLRARIRHSLKYKTVSLPDEPNIIEGYHYSCRRLFLALKPKYFEQVPSQKFLSTKKTGRNTNDHNDNDNKDDGCAENNTSTDSDVSKACIFCNHTRKTWKRKLLPLYNCEQETLVNIKCMAKEIKDVEILNKVESAMGGGTAHYHPHCKLSFKHKFEASELKEQTPYQTSRLRHKQAFEELVSYIQQEIIDDKKQKFLSSLLCIFEDYLLELSNLDKDEEVSFDEMHLEKKIKERFGKKIEIVVKYKVKIVLSTPGIVVSDELFTLLEENSVIEKSALILRKSILQMEKNQLPKRNLEIDHILKGECSIPLPIYNHYLTIICGPDQRRKNNINRKTKVNAICQDLVFATTAGVIKPSKHMTLGLTVLSKTNCKYIVDLLNRYGYCCSYSVLKELETELTYTDYTRSQTCPPGISLVPHLSTGVAFDNFDRFVETVGGKDTLHDTVGIIYQFEEVENPEESPVAGTSSTHSECLDDSEIEENEHGEPVAKKKRRRTFDAMSVEVAEYPRKPKMNDKLVLSPSAIRQQNNCSLYLYFDINLLWMLGHALEIDNLPMWVGFNSWFCDDNTLTQKVGYLTPINLSPTSTAVVHHTLVESLKIAEEVGQDYIQVTSDLAICKVVLQLRSTEAPKFDKIFPHMGGFHIDMAFKKAIGKFYEDCGLTSMMVESGMIASGSVDGLITGKHYNRCKRLYPIISLALQILHFESFTKLSGVELSPELINELATIINAQDYSILNGNGLLTSIMRQYLIYEEKTEAGEYGLTPQFYVLFVKLVDYSLIFSKSIRTADFELYKYILPKMNNLFFVMNQPNYARWLVKYHNDLVNVDETHPGLRAEFEKGAFGVKRTGKPFSRQPVDLTLEQTVNADAGRRLTGITHFTNSIGARQRWARSRILISTIISNVNDDIGLARKQDITADLEPNKLEKNCTLLKQFMDTLKNNMNPFDPDIDNDLLFNIRTGKAAKESTARFLLTVEEQGNKMRETFINECLENADRFEQRITRNKILNFSSENVKNKIKCNGKVQEVRMQRDLFGRLLGISMEQNIDVEKVMQYPITPVPMSLCHLDGKINKSQKSTLTKCLENTLQNHLENNRETVTVPEFDVVIIDGFCLLHQITDAPKTFGNLSKKILQMVTRYNARRIDIIFDRYFTPSIKDVERASRDAIQGLSYFIKGPDQTRSMDFKQELKNAMFKEALVKFLIDHWTSAELVTFIGDKKILLNHENCYSYQAINGKIVRQIEEDWACAAHEEADTKIVFHVTQINSPCNVLLKCNDTDIVVIMLGNMSNLKSPLNVWMLLGVGNSSRYLHLSKIYHVLGESVCNALPGLHALTGCDYNPSFFRKGKVKPFKILQQSVEYQNAFSFLGQEDLDGTSPSFAIIERFACDLYGHHSLRSVDKLRYVEFLSTYKPNVSNEKFQRKIKNLDASSLPPCQRELYQQFLRANYITSVWKNAYCKNPSTLLPEGNGWMLEDGKYEFVWFEGEQLPQFTDDVVIQPENDDEEIPLCGDNSYDSDDDET